MEKNTEYGTITLLAASSYGNATSTDSESTGANNTGVFKMSNGNTEYVANTLQQSELSEKLLNSNNGALTSANSRYVDEYIGTTKYSIPGDGIIETDGWGGYTNFIHSGAFIFRRGQNGIFGYDCYDWGGPKSNNGARAVVVCGTGL